MISLEPSGEAVPTILYVLAGSNAVESLLGSLVKSDLPERMSRTRGSQP
jgi:hypothetical protein